MRLVVRIYPSIPHLPGRAAPRIGPCRSRSRVGAQSRDLRSMGQRSSCKRSSTDHAWQSRGATGSSLALGREGAAVRRVGQRGASVVCGLGGRASHSVRLRPRRRGARRRMARPRPWHALRARPRAVRAVRPDRGREDGRRRRRGRGRACDRRYGGRAALGLGAVDAASRASRRAHLHRRRGREAGARGLHGAIDPPEVSSTASSAAARSSTSRNGCVPKSGTAPFSQKTPALRRHHWQPVKAPTQSPLPSPASSSPRISRSIGRSRASLRSGRSLGAARPRAPDQR